MTLCGPASVDDLEPHVLEHRQHVGQRDFALRVIKLEADRIGGRIGRLIQMKPDAAVGSDAFYLVKIKTALRRMNTAPDKKDRRLS